MATKSNARKSAKPAAANLAASVGNGKGKPAANVPPAPAPDAHAIARGEALRAIESAHGAAGAALVEGMRCAATHGAYELAEIQRDWPSCGQPSQYVANFARAHKAAQVIGTAATLEVIAGAVAIEGGRAFAKVMDALSAVMKAGKARASNGHTGIATGKAAELIVAGAIREAGKAQDTRSAAPKAGAKGAQPGKVTTVRTPTTGELLAAYVANAAALTKAAKPEDCSKAKWGRLLAAVRAAGELAVELAPAPKAAKGAK